VITSLTPDVSAKKEPNNVQISPKMGGKPNYEQKITILLYDNS
jgi:hypothetical protein